MEFPIDEEYKGYRIVIETGVVTETGSMEDINDHRWTVGKVEIRHRTSSGSLETVKTLKPKDYFPTADEAKKNAIKLAKEEIEKFISQKV